LRDVALAFDVDRTGFQEDDVGLLQLSRVLDGDDSLVVRNVADIKLSSAVFPTRAARDEDVGLPDSPSRISATPGSAS
jgi:hypothetical protein